MEVEEVLRDEVLGLILNPALIAPIATGVLTWLAASKKTNTDFSAATVDKWNDLYAMIEKQRDDYKEEVERLRAEIAECPNRIHRKR